jgi:ferredoxin-NADP reductase/DMSO/TMAO reductase YedYZ heme-binding membrane subunit
MAWRGWRDDLTANPVEFITHFTGDWSIRFLAFTLAITPLRKLLRQPELVRFRRMLGLTAFFYGSLHFLTWFWLDRNLDFREMAADLVKRRFILAGSIALFCMLPLALTSTAGWVRRLGAKRWQALHRLVYVSALAAVVHYYWLVKSDIRWPVFYAVVFALLIGSRALLSARRDASGLSLTLAAIERQTPGAVTLRFPLTDGRLAGVKPGQFLTFDWVVNGKVLPRSYSMSSSPLESEHLEITVREEGVVSTFLNRDARPGLTVVARGPYGQFCFDESRHRSIALIVAGSGITPVMSMLRYIERQAPDVDVTLLYGVRTAKDVIFRDEIARLGQRLPRFRYTIAVSRPELDWQGWRGRINRELIEREVSDPLARTFFLCGPAGFMADVKGILLALGVDPARILEERFVPERPKASEAVFPVEFAKSGARFECSSAVSLLEAAESHGIEIPYDCRVGQCGTCATRVLAGEVEMDAEDGLDPALKAQGYRLMCVGHARGPVRLDA